MHKSLDNIRSDYRHKVTAEIVKIKESQMVIKNGTVSGMLKNKHLYKAKAHKNFYEFEGAIVMFL